MSETVLCLDIGTTSLKAGLITAEGEVVSFCSVPFENPQNNYIAASWFNYLATALKSLDESACYSTEISGIAISGNGPTIVTDSGFTILWNDSDSYDCVPDAAKYSLFIPKILKLKKDFSSEYKSTKHIFSGPEYLIYILTGKAVTILPEKRFFAAYWTEEICHACKISFEKLPPFVSTGTVCGELDPEVIKSLLSDSEYKNVRFLDNCKVIAGGPDFVVALIGTNTLTPGKICDRCGSSEGINLCVDTQIFKEGVRTLPSVIPGLWNVSVLIPDSGTVGNEIRLQRIKTAIEVLKDLCEENKIVFPSEMSVTGGQSMDLLLSKEKSELLNMKILQTIINGTIFAHSELLGDACAAYVGIGKYKNLQEAAEKIVNQRVQNENL